MKPLLETVRVLVVDDMPANIDSYRGILRDLGIRRENIFAATNGLKGFTSLDTTRPDLVLADWNMPVMDGLTFCRKLRETGRHDTLAILMITAESDLDIERARGIVNAFLRKPVQNHVISKMILTVLGKKMADPSHPLHQRAGMIKR